MNEEYLQIRNFGPIVDVELKDIRRINVFIGESGSGKSTIMKALGMFRWLFKMHCIRSYLKLSGIKNIPFRMRSERILTDNGLIAFVRPDSFMEYIHGDFRCTIKGGKLSMPKDLLPLDQLSLEKIAYVTDKRDMIPDLITGNVSLKHGMFFLEDTLGNFQKALDMINSTSLPYLGIKMDVRKTSLGRRVFVSSLNEKTEFTNLPLRNASSGVQSTVALHFILQYFASSYDVVDAINSSVVSYLASSDSLSNFKAAADIGAFPHRRISLLVEEPELSLFPSNQRGLVNHMVSQVNTSCVDLVMATHSPYILTALNVLMLADKAMAKDRESTINVLGNDITLSSRIVGAWEIKDGCSHGLIDREAAVIDGTWLDSVSETFDEEIFQLNRIVYA